METIGATLMRGTIIAILLICCGIATPARAGEAGDRILGSDMNRDKAENRIERLHEDKKEIDKARAEKKVVPGQTTKKKKKVVKPVSPN